MPKISLITAAYNSEKTFAACLSSVANQSFADLEHIIIDGGSKDKTPAIAADFSHVSLVVSEPDRGIYDAMNKGISLAHGEIVGVLNSDDCYAFPDILSNVATVFEDPSVNACYGDLLYVDDADMDVIVRYWRSGHFSSRRFYWGWMPPHPTFFVRRFVYERFGKFNLDLGSAADYELMLRFLVKYQIGAAYIPKVMVKMRTGGISNRSWVNRWNAHKMDRKAWVTNGLIPYPWTLWAKPLRKIGQWWPGQC